MGRTDVSTAHFPYNASKLSLIGLTERPRASRNSHRARLPGITKTPLPAKTTQEGTATIDAMSAIGRTRYRDLSTPYATMSASSNDMPILSTESSKLGADPWAPADHQRLRVNARAWFPFGGRRGRAKSFFVSDADDAISALFSCWPEPRLAPPPCR